MNKLKIINDPVYGFITIPYEIIFDLIEHQFFQRLRRINQLGLAQLVYPGAIHTRFNHALGALNLMIKALNTLEQKGIELTSAEKEAACIAILLHDLGHSPFSHVLEKNLIPSIHHEKISLELMNILNKQYNGKLSLAIEIFKNRYKKKFLHQLVSSQLDMDRLDYLTRDSFYTGVSEGIVGIDRIINMLSVYKNELVVEEKGIYSIEKFIVARRIMYWQVYLHKTTIAADQILTNIIKRVKFLLKSRIKLEISGDLKFFMTLNEKTKINEDILLKFVKTDDIDLMYNIKQWQNSNDFVLSFLCRALVNRHLPKIIIQNKLIKNEELVEKTQLLQNKFPELKISEIDYLINTGVVKNEAYTFKGTIKIQSKNGEIKELTNASDNYNLTALSEKVTKYFLCYFQ
ncbi:MAG: HD domain-containing protein [Bacteroidetes bacterium]|nr:HD domain-containing protein [Bacteroidota bacterium]